MANVTFMDGIATIRGKLGDTIYRRTASGKTIAYKAPEHVCRQATRKEMKQRQRFALVCKVVRLILLDPMQHKAYEKELKKKNVEQYKLRQYVFKQVWEILPK